MHVWRTLPGEVERRGLRALLLVGDRRRSPRRVLPGPFLPDDEGRPVPVGWLPAIDPATLKTFAQVGAAIQAREGPVGPLAFLGQWDPQVQRMVARSHRILARGGSALRPLWWTADRLVRRDLLVALRLGPGLAFYFGHGRPYGWQGYHGLHTRHLRWARGEPVGAILSLTCRTASRHRVGLSFAEELVLQGICGACLAACTATRTIDNWWWATCLEEALARDPPEDLATLLVRAAPARPEAVAAYRIIGDPMARLIGAPGAEVACQAVWAPAPDDSPTPPGYLDEVDRI